jgi:hypothetical protein
VEDRRAAQRQVGFIYQQEFTIMADVKEDQAPAKTKSELVARNEQQLVEIAPHGVPQATFPEQMRQGLPGMINRMVDYNAVTRSAEGSPIPACRAVSQSTASDVGALLGGTVAGFVGITILDPTIVLPVGTAGAPETYPQYANLGVLTKGEIFATATVATLAGDPVHFGAADGILTNTGAVGPVPGARWKYARPANELNVVQLGIQR